MVSLKHNERLHCGLKSRKLSVKKTSLLCGALQKVSAAPAAQLLAVLIAATIDTISSAVAQFFLLLSGSHWRNARIFPLTSGQCATLHKRVTLDAVEVATHSSPPVPLSHTPKDHPSHRWCNVQRSMRHSVMWRRSLHYLGRTLFCDIRLSSPDLRLQRVVNSYYVVGSKFPFADMIIINTQNELLDQRCAQLAN